MKNKHTFIQSHIFPISLGILFSVLLLIPYFILGKASVFTYHDQLDGEMISYLLTAKYLFTGVKVYPELLNGLPATGAIPPAYLFVLLYKIFTPFHALLISQWIISVVAFIGMYFLAFIYTKNRYVAFLSGIIFMLLPFYPVYGLCIPGQPLLWYCVSRLSKGKPQKRDILYLLLIFLYSLCSSLVLVGFACLIVLFAVTLYRSILAWRKHTKTPLCPWISLIVLLSGYLISNLSLIRQIISPLPGMLSHKAEIVYRAEAFIVTFIRHLYPGENYTETWPLCIILLVILSGIFLMSASIKKQKSDLAFSERNLILSSYVFAFLVLCALWCAIYSTEPFIRLRSALPGAISGFNLSRISWLMPTAWILLAAFLSNAIVSSLPTPEKKESDKSLKIHTFSYVLRYGSVFIIYLLWSGLILLNSPLKINISKIIKGPDNYYALDFEKFYAEEIFDQIDQAIGLPKDSYRVVSLGIYPAVAAYNGFYCLDGYSNNYPLEYKHTFREVFAGELDKNDYIRSYYDEWGNRCYITTAEYSNYYCVERKWNGGFHNLSINTDKLKELGCKYIFSATWILNYEDLNLKPLREEPFISENSWYNIYVYEIN